MNKGLILIMACLSMALNVNAGDALDLGSSVLVNVNYSETADPFILQEIERHFTSLTSHPPRITFKKKSKAPGIELNIDTALGPDVYVSKIVGDKILITGGDERGVYYGVMDFLEALGCRWFAPGEGNSVIPKLKTARIAKAWKSSGKPSFHWRGYHICGYGETRDGERIPHYDYDTALWMARNKMNFKPIHNTEYDEMAPIMEKVMLTPIAFGHSYSHWFSKKDFETHPEYFALIQGKRNRKGQLCLSNKEMRTELVNRIARFAEKRPGMPFISLAPNDGYCWCECESCVAMDTPEDKRAREINTRNHSFARDIAVAVKKRLPRLKISTIAYCNYLNPGPSVPYESNLAVSICATYDRNTPLEDQSSRANRILLDRVRKWSAKAGTVFWSEYILSYGGTFPRPYAKQTQKTLKVLIKEGLNGFKSEVSAGRFKNWKSSIFYMYCVARLLYDVNTDTDKLLKDFCDKFYGPASEPVMKYYLLNQKIVENYSGFFHAMNAKILPELYSLKDIEQLRCAIDKARKAAENNPTILQRVDLLARQLNEISEGRAGILAAEKEAKPVTAKFAEKRPDWNCFENTKLIPIRDRTNLLEFKPPSGFAVAATEKALWLYVRCGEPNDDYIRKNDSKLSGGIWGSSNVDCFISPNPKSGVYYQFSVNYAGKVYDSKCEGRSQNSNYDMNLDIRARNREFGWEVIIGLPFDKLSARPKNGDSWRLSVNRGQKCGGPTTLGGWPHGGAWHKIEAMGILRFDNASLKKNQIEKRLEKPLEDVL